MRLRGGGGSGGGQAEGARQWRLNPSSSSPPLPSPPPPSPSPAGTVQWPGANFILFPTGEKVYLKFGDRRRIASELRIGDTVERHLDSE